MSVLDYLFLRPCRSFSVAVIRTLAIADSNVSPNAVTPNTRPPFEMNFFSRFFCSSMENYGIPHGTVVPRPKIISSSFEYDLGVSL